MLTAVLKAIDVDGEDPGAWVPDDLVSAALWVTLSIGEDNSPAADLFQVLVCTPQGLRELRMKGDRWEPHIVVQAPWSWEHAREAVEERVQACARAPDTLDALRKDFAWEYEGYR